MPLAGATRAADRRREFRLAAGQRAEARAERHRLAARMYGPRHVPMGEAAERANAAIRRMADRLVDLGRTIEVNNWSAGGFAATGGNVTVTRVPQTWGAANTTTATTTNTSYSTNGTAGNVATFSYPEDQTYVFGPGTRLEFDYGDGREAFFPVPADQQYTVTMRRRGGPTFDVEVRDGRGVPVFAERVVHVNATRGQADFDDQVFHPATRPGRLTRRPDGAPGRRYPDGFAADAAALRGDAERVTTAADAWERYRPSARGGFVPPPMTDEQREREERRQAEQVRREEQWEQGRRRRDAARERAVALLRMVLTDRDEYDEQADTVTVLGSNGRRYRLSLGHYSSNVHRIGTNGDRASFCCHIDGAHQYPLADNVVGQVLALRHDATDFESRAVVEMGERVDHEAWRRFTRQREAEYERRRADRARL